VLFYYVEIVVLLTPAIFISLLLQDSRFGVVDTMFSIMQAMVPLFIEEIHFLHWFWGVQQIPHLTP